MKVLTPPEVIDVDEPVIFLAGPIQGAPEWQAEAIKLIEAENPAVVVANPRRAYLSGEFDYVRQVDWETHYLNRAARNGVILFWLAKEQTEVPGRAYAQTTRFELAEWKVKHERDAINLVVGIEPGFTNARYISRRFSQDCPEVPLGATLAGTCRLALDLASGKK